MSRVLVTGAASGLGAALVEAFRSRGDEVLACIVLRKAPNTPPAERLATSIVRHALERLTYFKAPGYVAFVEALPLTVSQKIQRSELRELARNLPGAPNCIDTRAMKRRRKAVT